MGIAKPLPSKIKLKLSFKLSKLQTQHSKTQLKIPENQDKIRD